MENWSELNWGGGWQVKILHTGGFTTKVWILRPATPGGDLDVLYFEQGGGTKIVRSPRTDPEPAPTFTLGMREAIPIMRAFAAELAQVGFTVLDSGGVTKAKDEHIKSLEKQAERLFTLAERAPLVVKVPVP